MANLSHLPQQWRESGLSQRAFCEREHIHLATFAYWRRKQLDAEAGGAGPASSAAFTEVRAAPASVALPETAPRLLPVAIEIRFPGGMVVRIPMPPTC